MPLPRISSAISLISGVWKKGSVADVQPVDLQIIVGIRSGRRPPSPDGSCSQQAWQAAIDEWEALWVRHSQGCPLSSPLEACEEKASSASVPCSEEDGFAGSLERALLPRRTAREACAPAVRTAAAHFLEDLARLRWAVSTGVPTYAVCSMPGYFKPEPDAYRWIGIQEGHSGRWPMICVMVANSNRPPCPSAALLLLGLLSIRFGDEHPRLSFPRSSNCDLYWSSPWFLRLAGREHAWVGMDDLPEALLECRRQGWPGAFVKGTAVKHGTWVIRFPSLEAGEMTPGAMAGLVIDAMGAPSTMFGPDGLPGTFIVQSLVDFVDEYRIVVVNGRIRCGTPVRRADTPLASRVSGVREGRMRPFMCRDREADGPRHDRARTAAYARAARRILRAMGRDGRGELVLDLGTDAATGAIIPVEVNALNSAGLYGMRSEPAWNALLSTALAEVERIKPSIALERAMACLGLDVRHVEGMLLNYFGVLPRQSTLLEAARGR